MTNTTETARATIAELMGGRDEFERFLCDRMDEHEKTIAKLRADHNECGDDAQIADEYIQRLERDSDYLGRQIQREAKRTKEAYAQVKTMRSNLTKRDETIKELEAKIATSTALRATVENYLYRIKHEAAGEKPKFTVTLTDFGDNKMIAIKMVRGVTGLCLKDAKAIVDSAPAVIEDGLSKEEADLSKAWFGDAGITVEIS
jgi:large subunit ribosomal protein L7/L12